MIRILILLIIAVGANAADQSLDLLHKAVRSDNMQSVLRVLNNDKDEVYTPAALGKALHCTRSSDIVELLIMRGAEVDAPSHQGYTRLWLAANDEGQTQLAEILLRHKASVNFRPIECWGQTALYRAALLKNIDMVALLLKHKADVNITDSVGRTPFEREFEIITGGNLVTIESSQDDRDKEINAMLEQAQNEAAAENAARFHDWVKRMMAQFQ